VFVAGRPWRRRRRQLWRYWPLRHWPLRRGWRTGKRCCAIPTPACTSLRGRRVGQDDGNAGAAIIVNRMARARFPAFPIARTLLMPDQRAVSLLDHLPGWRRIYSDAHAVIHVHANGSVSKPLR